MIGNAHVRCEAGENPEMTSKDYLSLFPQHQGRGAGTEFLSMIAQRLKSRGIVGMVLLTEREMPACRFYIQNGFETREEQVFLVKML